MLVKNHRKCAKRSAHWVIRRIAVTCRIVPAVIQNGTSKETSFRLSMAIARSAPPIHTHTQRGRWDMIIAFPPCTYMTNAGAVRMRVKGEIVPERYAKAMEAKEFFMKFYNADCERVVIENPVPMKIVGLPPYSQTIQPYEHGHPYSKKTCLWLRGVPPLMATEILAEHEPYVNGGCKDAHGNYKRFQGRKERDAKTRSKTFPGIARAMAEQWGVNR